MAPPEYIAFFIDQMLVARAEPEPAPHVPQFFEEGRPQDIAQYFRIGVAFCHPEDAQDNRTVEMAHAGCDLFGEKADHRNIEVPVRDIPRLLARTGVPVLAVEDLQVLSRYREAGVERFVHAGREITFVAGETLRTEYFID